MPPSETSRHRPTLGVRLDLQGAACATRRRRIEGFVEAIYAETYGSRIDAHYPNLISLQDDEGVIYAAAGFRLAAAGPLFLEQYLSEPVEDAVGAASGLTTPRAAMAEIGGLASNGRGATVFLFSALACHLARQGVRVAVATATSDLRAIFDRAGLETWRLAAATPDRLPDGGAAWGDYYKTAPAVIAGSIPHAAGPLGHFLNESTTGRSVAARLAFRSASA
ncbi:MAG: thermostable hemolysin [Caulobacteraceae bacterium]